MSHKFSRIEKIFHKRERAREEGREGVSEGLSRFSVKILMAHSNEKLRSGTFLCFTHILVSKNVRDKRGREYHDFAVKLLCLTVPNHFVEESLCLSESFRIEKIIPERGVSRFYIENFLSHCTEQLRRGTH